MELMEYKLPGHQHKQLMTYMHTITDPNTNSIKTSCYSVWSILQENKNTNIEACACNRRIDTGWKEVHGKIIILATQEIKTRHTGIKSQIIWPITIFGGKWPMARDPRSQSLRLAAKESEASLKWAASSCYRITVAWSVPMGFSIIWSICCNQSL